MALDAGDSTCALGTMARSIYDQLRSVWGEYDADTNEDDSQRDLAAAIAEGVVSHITANADVRVTIGTGDSGLQRDPGTSTDTLGPSSSRSLEGSIS